MNFISPEISSLLPAPALEPSASAAIPGPADAAPSGFGQVFAELAAGLPHGQSLAAEVAGVAGVGSVAGVAGVAGSQAQDAASAPGLSTEAWMSGAGALAALTLQAVDLGPSMRVITPVSAPPDAGSLAAFAKAQGLDDAAVHWLLGGPAGAGGAAGGGLANPASGFMPGGTASAPGLTAASWMGQPGAQPPPTPDELTALVTAASRGGLWQRGALAAAGGVDAAATANGAAKTSTAPVEVVLDLGSDLGLPDGLEGLDGDVPAEAQGANQGTAGTGGAGGSASTAGLADLGGRLPASPALGAERASPPADLAPRSEQYQALAQRLGEAMAQRLMAQVERGHWNVRFMLRPQSLGQVEVELRMRAGEMDAVFKTPHALTRELINDGLPRLRELLSQMGMDVAQIHVGTGQSQKNGGNPTPRQAPPGAEDVVLTGSAEADSPASRPRQTGGADGWDVLV